MRIKKVEPSVGILGKILNIFSNSNKDTYSCDYINNAIKEVYSEEETVVGTWMGKPLYRKVFTGTKNRNSDLTIGILSNADSVTSIRGILVDNLGNRKPIPFYYSDDIFITVEIQSSGNIILHGAPSDYASGSVTLIIEYTKTTDSGVTN